MKPEIGQKYILNITDIPVDLDGIKNSHIEHGYLLWNDEGKESIFRMINTVLHGH